MAYALLYTREAARQIKQLPAHIRLRVRAQLKTLPATPLAGKKLKGGLSAYRSLRVGEYRIIYEARPTPRQIVVLTVRPRGSAYRL